MVCEAYTSQMAKSKPPSPPDRPTRAQIEQLRAQSAAYLKSIAGKPLSEKMKQDAAILESVRATKH